MPMYSAPFSAPNLTPAFGLGSYNRTGPAILLGGPRSKIGSQNRIYSSFRTAEQRAAYVQYLAFLLGK